MHFKSRKGIVFGVIIGVIQIILFFIMIRAFTQKPWSYEMLFPLGLIVASAFFILWLWFATSYNITLTHLHYQSGPFKGKIPVDQITEIIVNKTLWAGMRPATARGGLIVKYNKYDEIYISPYTNESFLKILLEYNPNIKITQHA